MKNCSYLLGKLNSFFFITLKLLGLSILRSCFSFEVKNPSLVPHTGPFIVVANHSSFMDPPVLQAACPRRIYFMMTEKYYNPLWGRWFFKLMHAIPLREGTFYNIGALKRGLKVLKEGNVIGIFPEGGISKNGVIRDGKPGTLLLAQKSDVPLVPCFISGTFQALPRDAKFFRKAKIKVIFGNPLKFEDLSEGTKGKDALEKATKNLIRKIKDLAQSET